MTYSAFIEPLDVWSFRGNRVFGAAGSWGEAVMPPPPSVVAGALRSALLARSGVDWQAFADNREEARHPLVGLPDEPGVWRLQDLTLAMRRAPEQAVEPIYPWPADAVLSDAQVRMMRPQTLPQELRCSQSALPQLPVLADGGRSKPLTGRWLSAQGLRQWIAGQPIAPTEALEAEALWRVEERVGIALDPLKRRAEDQRLFSLQAIACHPGVGLAVRVHGAPLHEGLLRLGGDGRGARLLPQAIDWPQPDVQAIARAGRAKLLLSSPGLFPQGWLPTGADVAQAGVGVSFELHGVRARIVAAAVPRAQVISGFDVARRRPKTAQRVVPAGAVYWLDELQATPEAIQRLLDEGLWPSDPQAPGWDPQRRAEGYNRCLLGLWP
ncbi:type III-B CRISPR module-associated Cmr3 family protein [Caldimonas taiwanensis]|uniref:type III-B CRISPR module-associated Cmr3 family protein n=1 Tax=Caldimonas taiwanensis TaxID=307483 RepID=UPI000781D20E|nr:type III-B CRISPR module-associated Cmr3 family protein [Caldimonas taiwanensis]